MDKHKERIMMEEMYKELKKAIFKIIDNAIDKLPEEHRDAAKEYREQFFKKMLQHYYDNGTLPASLEITHRGFPIKPRLQ